MISLTEVRNSWTEEKKDFNRRTSLWIYYVIRPLSFYFTWLILPLGVSANQVTVLSLLVGLAGCTFLALGYNSGVCIGSLLINFFWILDASDGNIARVTGTSTLHGKFLDATVGQIMSIMPWLCLGIALCRTPDDSLNGLFNLFLTDINMGLRQQLFLFLGIAVALSRSLCKTLSYFFLNIKRQYKNGQSKSNYLEDDIGEGYSSLRLIYNNVTRSQGIQPSLLLVAAFTQALSIYLAFFAVVHSLDLIVRLGWYIYNLRKLTRQELAGAKDETLV